MSCTSPLTLTLIDEWLMAGERYCHAKADVNAIRDRLAREEHILDDPNVSDVRTTWNGVHSRSMREECQKETGRYRAWLRDANGELFAATDQLVECSEKVEIAGAAVGLDITDVTKLRLTIPKETDKQWQNAVLCVEQAKIWSPSGDSDAPEKLSEAKLTDAPTDTSAAAFRLLNILTNGLADERFDKACNVLNDDQRTADEKLWEIDELIPIPPTTSGAKIGKALGVSKAAIQRTTWYIEKRKGERDSEIGRRHEQHHQRAQQYKSERKGDDG